MKDSSFRFAVWATILLTIGLTGLRLKEVIDGDLAQMIGAIFGGLLAAYFGASVGASAAMKHQDAKEKREKTALAVENANALIFAIQRRRVAVLSIIESIGDGAKGPAKHLELQPLVLPQLDIPLPMEKQTALLHSGGAELLIDVSQLDLEYSSTIELVRRRNKVYEDMQQVLMSSGISIDKIIKQQDLSGLGIEFHELMIEGLTKTMMESLQILPVRHQSVAKRIQEYVGAKFLKPKIQDYVDPPGGR